MESGALGEFIVANLMLGVIFIAKDGMMLFFNKLILALFLVALPLALPVLGFGLSGSSSKHYIFIAVGYLLAIITALPVFSNSKVRYAPILGVLIVAVGIYLDSKFWENHNNDLCLELRSNPSCVEDETGFHCSNWAGEGIDFSTSKSICKSVPK